MRAAGLVRQLIVERRIYRHQVFKSGGKSFAGQKAPLYQFQHHKQKKVVTPLK
jgi:hypothetical protein